MKYVGFTLENVCALYSILPHELDAASLALLREDLDKTCMSVFGVGAFIYGDLEVVG